MDFQDLYDWLFNQRPDGVGIPLKGTGIVLGLFLIGTHLWALLKAKEAVKFAREFPRHRVWGITLMVISLVWTLFLISHMDMTDFHPWRNKLMFILPLGTLLMIIYVPEFLAVRALGCLMLLAASPVLNAAFLQPQVSRLLLPILAYAWVIAGMFLVGMPYLLRDGIDWASDQPGRWKALTLAGVGYGALTLAASVLWY